MLSEATKKPFSEFLLILFVQAVVVKVLNSTVRTVSMSNKKRSLIETTQLFVFSQTKLVGFATIECTMKNAVIKFSCN